MIDDENIGIASAVSYTTDVVTTKRRNFKELQARMSPQRRRKNKAAANAVLKKFPSQELPQLPAVRFDDGDAWVLDSIERFRMDFLAEHGLPVEQAQVVRRAISETLAKLGKRQMTGRARKLGRASTGTRSRLGPIRVTRDFPTLIDDVEVVAKRSKVQATDVIRWALERWLRGQGYGPKG